MSPILAQNTATPEPPTTQEAQKVIITMSNGDEFRGVIVKQDAKIIILKMVNGEIKLIVSNVKSIENDEYTGAFSFDNPHDTRYFFGASGIPIDEGEGYYQNIYVLFNFVNYGVSKHFSIGGGFEFMSTVMGEPVWFLTPKFGFKLKENVHLGTGLLIGGLSNEGSFTLAYSSLTLGSTESNFTFGLGYGIADGEFTEYPVIMIAGTHRLSNHIALISENYIIPHGGNDNTAFGIQGIRILARDNAFDIGAIISPLSDSSLPALPYVGYSRSF
jgi:hypothetical protein